MSKQMALLVILCAHQSWLEEDYPTIRKQAKREKAGIYWGDEMGLRSDMFQEFLTRLVRQSNRKVFLIVDGHPVHHSKKITKWVEKNTDHISLFFLPGYSPELNPDEMLNQDVKSNAVGRKRAHNQQELLTLLKNIFMKKMCNMQRCKK